MKRRLSTDTLSKGSTANASPLSMDILQSFANSLKNNVLHFWGAETSL
jgi:hypothetical protein